MTQWALNSSSGRGPVWRAAHKNLSPSPFLMTNTVSFVLGASFVFRAGHGTRASCMLGGPHS